jgi:ferredoxin-NADP reductase
MPWRTVGVAAVREETATARTLVLEPEGWPGHRAGQHVDVRLTAEDGYQAERAYSIASAPELGSLELTVERLDDGEVSPYLVDDVRSGDELELRGPIGGYFTWEVRDGGPLLLVAGGSGLVPLMAMLRHRAAQGSDVEARLLVSARHRADLLYAGELDAVAAGGVDVRVTLTRERPPDWTGLLGRVDEATLADLGPPEAAPRTFVCGPTAFVEHVAELLVGLGHDPRTVKTERFGATGGRDG